MGFLSKLFTKSVPRDANDIFNEIAEASMSISGVAVTPNTALSVSTFFSCVRVISESISKLPLILYERLPNGGKKRAYSHPLYNLLHNSPNEMQTALEFWETAVIHLLLRGNYFAYISRSSLGNKVLELLPLNPDMVTIRKNDDWTLSFEVRSGSGKPTRTYSQNEIFYLRGMSLDGVKGISIVEYQKETLGLAQAAQNFGARMFTNGARPGGVVKYPTSMKEEARKKLENAINRAYGGSNAFRTMVLDEGMEWVSVGMSSKDVQFFELRGYQRAEIAGFMRVPLHKIQDLQRSTNNNIEHQSQEFIDDCLQPWGIRIQQNIFKQLLSKTEQKTYFAEFLFDSLLRSDTKSRYEAHKAAIEGGIKSPDEVREQENMNHREDGLGGKYWMPLNYRLAEDPIDTGAKGGNDGGNGK